MNIKNKNCTLIQIMKFFAELVMVENLVIGQTSTSMELWFDLAMDPSSCDSLHLYLQSSDKNIIFRPSYEAKCDSNLPFGYSSNRYGDNILITLNESDHLRLLGKPYNELLKENQLTVNIDSDFIHTVANIMV